jgi:TamB, inner membrane protein subunit of TAM complex
MLSPLINFDIMARDLPQSISVNNQLVNLNFEFAAFKNRLDEQELKRQVFSLIVLRRFSPPESFSTSGSVVNSVSELLSNQLSYWMSQVDENLEIDVDLNTLNQEAFNTFQLRLSYTFLNGRLRVTGDGTYMNQNQAAPVNANSNTNVSALAGDWTVDYLLTPDGKFKVKMYNRTNVNPILNTLGQNTVTTGVSLIHTQSFNELRDLLKSARKNSKKDVKDETPVNEEAIKDEDVIE